ncbi:VWA domain-containing protein [Candidatus Woesearchaeota archaeon]|nr:VWA domain-containing protein [Candidatus Woesearchaeota archaeon]
MEIIFERPEYMWLLFSIPILIIAHFITLKKIRRRAVKFANFAAIQRITGGELLSKNLFLLVIRVLILILFIFSISGFTIIYTGIASNYDYVIAMDNSNSMIVEDFEPNRLEAAKTAAKDFINKLGPDNFVGVLSFSSVSLVDSPLSNDLLNVKGAIDGIKLSEVGGTDMGQAIVNGVNMLINSDKGKAIILLSDGQGNIGLPIDEAINYANSKEVIVHTIGMGTTEGSDFFGTILVLDEASLIYIAENTEGEYYKAENTDELKDAYSKIGNLTERKISNNLSMTFIVLALILLLYEWILINTKYRTIP